MENTKERYPWWRTTLADVEQTLTEIRRGEVKNLCLSAGGRPLPYVTWGNPVYEGHGANYNSACGAKNPAYYADRANNPPVVMLVGAIHGQETEGTAALLNLIHLIETGSDFRGVSQDTLGLDTDRFFSAGGRLILIPVMNPDGRARCVPDSMLEMTPEELRHWGQGNWTDGTLCGWPECKSVHPIGDKVSFLGAYYNDDGVNLMHDDFFNPMARETAALLKLTAQEAPDYIILLHGGSNTTNMLMRPKYVPDFIDKKRYELAQYIAELAEQKGLPAKVAPMGEDTGYPPPAFNLTSALHHVCGGVALTYESNEGLLCKHAFSAEDILAQHYLLFRGVFEKSLQR